MKMHATLLLALALLATGCATPQAPAEGPIVPITLAIQPTDNAQAIQDKATELEAFLESAMLRHGVRADVRIVVPLTYVGVVEALRFGHADVAMMSAWPASLAAKRADARIVLAEQREVIVGTTPTTGPFYESYYVVLKDAPIQDLAALKGKSVAYPSASSTSGYVFPLAKLVDEGHVPRPEAGKEADPKALFGEVRFAGGYAQAWEALKNRQVDAAVIAGDVNAKLYDEVRNATRVVATQGPIPSHAVVYAKDFQGPAADALTASFLELKDEKRDLMRKLVSGIFVEFRETTTENHTAGLAGALDLTGLKLAERLG